MERLTDSDSIAGQTVRIRAYGGETVKRYVLSVQGDVLLVCRPEELEAARREGREPNYAGCHISHVIRR